MKKRLSGFCIKRSTVHRHRLAGRKFTNLYIILFRSESREVH